MRGDLHFHEEHRTTTMDRQEVALHLGPRCEGVGRTRPGNPRAIVPVTRITLHQDTTPDLIPRRMMTTVLLHRPGEHQVVQPKRRRGHATSKTIENVNAESVRRSPSFVSSGPSNETKTSEGIPKPSQRANSLLTWTMNRVPSWMIIGSLAERRRTPPPNTSMMSLVGEAERTRERVASMILGHTIMSWT